jgi:hypothetical protein
VRNAGQLVIREAEDVESVWVVDNYMDTVRRRKRKAVEKENRDPGFMRQVIVFFPSEAEALRFLVERAEKRVREKSDELGAAKRRLAKCRRRLEALGVAA